MSPPTERRLVRVPASTSNLGPGFDCLGMALTLWLDVEASTRDGGGGHVFERRGGHAQEWPVGAGELLTETFDRTRAALGLAPLPLSLAVASQIPLERGLGSSGAAVAAGLLLAAGWEDPGQVTARRPELLRLGVEREGHPDNVTASVWGGATLAIPSDGVPTVVAVDPHESIGVAVAWPATGVSTAAARAALPATVPFSDAVENPRRLAALVEGLRRGDETLVRLGGEDRLHVQHRLPAIEGGAGALDAAREAGAWTATISGSGSALVALGARGTLEPVARAMAEHLGRRDGPAQGLVVEIARRPASVLSLGP